MPSPLLKHFLDDGSMAGQDGRENVQKKLGQLLRGGWVTKDQYERVVAEVRAFEIDDTQHPMANLPQHEERTL